MANESFSTLLQVELPGFERIGSGKVREMFAVDDRLLIVTTDRISAFDCVLPVGIPYKGIVLNQISIFWFHKFKDLLPNHLVCGRVAEMPPALQPHAGLLRGRSMLVRRAEVLPVECIVRGYLAGSGWNEYRMDGTICGLPLPGRLSESDRLPQPIFTPSTKSVFGHDENISFDDMCGIIGAEKAERVRALSLALYQQAAAYAEGQGIIIADTKFEFGEIDGQLILVDEVLTPDSSRFWPADGYKPGRPQPSFDKQYVRDYLLGLDWDRQPPAPPLPEPVIQKTSEKYLEAFRRLTGVDLLAKH
ncbi:MAG TPA: phosphoribosylaminoimidazolesuccinocarboxamide synthase [Acidobacteriota bacterium]|jgi:phosphoribosylaminoimidazole-succinocarboxamide synthase|nr:phosphoribosylaminoimidazolesuccinocarboxamide synthase [Acidobacteriota bacterium]HPB27732.1 phosphoribosylaminoimidazolesuccinocarboxamide synthase [Acidobacteriota bacterium]HQO24836.1 phosphoribosylaminoimidazolesuccinocarboxamide synthase [Acidobacteriota bacterium]HQP72707.1 phosphoribosylaminoimidazolesuccinocarboxamide synthase [Acidobacteriota bacterium]